MDSNTKYFNELEVQIAAERLELKNLTKEVVEDFSETLSRVRDIIYQQKYDGAVSGFFNAGIISRDLGFVDKRELTGKGGSALHPVPSIHVTTVTSIHNISEDDEDEDDKE